MAVLDLMFCSNYYFLFHSGGGLIVYSEANPSYSNNGVETKTRKRKVVLLGTGWAGASFLKTLNNSSYEVQVISPRNYFAFTPLLPSVTCGTVEARSVVEPIRNIARKQNVEMSFLEAECFKIDPGSKKVYCRSKQGVNSKGKKEFDVDYDYLVIATGAQSNTFNIPGVEENCHFLKEVEDAQRIRSTVIDSFEKASLPGLNEQERKRMLHFVVVGGGPTGVEFASELHDFVNEDLVKLYPKAKNLVQITLLEAADHILTMFDKRITEFAEEKFTRDGIDVKLGSMVVKVNDKEISAKTKAGEVSTIPYGMIVWSTGIGTRPVIKDFMKQIGQVSSQRRALATDEWLRVEGCDNIYALGDCATINQRKVMVAAQQGTYLAKCFDRMEVCEKNPEGPIRIRGEGRHRFRPFRYRHLGQFAPLGGEQTAAQLPGDWVSIGHSSQWLWYSVYASKQVSWRTRVLVVSDWMRRFIFGRDSSRI
ncbi:NADH dehydrogenase like protein [Arabidopsis thaliana]|nr:NADH dehydrogenase like protein [Arabidopsis thaliana]CAB81256.1 NADH dehydrogenase like protein [Arabidopsis thaliana]